MYTHTHTREKERERDNRLAFKAFSSLPTIREMIGLVMGIPERKRNSPTRSQIAFLRQISFCATPTAAVQLNFIHYR